MQSQVMFSRYKIVTKLGEGGMGIVYKAFDLKTQNSVAIKLLHKSSLSKESSLKRFEREMKLTASLKHPNIINVISYNEKNSTPYLVMDYIEGVSFLDYINQYKPNLKKKLELLEKIIEALEYAHSKNILHRDIKPSNIIIKKDGTPLLMDFGLAKSNEIDDKSITLSREVLGTPQYMAPEQARGRKKEIDYRTDIYGIGGVLYYILMGKPPVTGSNIIEILYKVVDNKITFQSNIPYTLQCICRKTLEKKKTQRYSSVADLHLDIKAYLQQKKIKATSFYQFRILTSTFAFLLFLAMFSILFSFVFHKTEKKKTARYYYKQARKAKNVEIAYIYLSKAFELIKKERQTRKTKKLQKGIQQLLFLTYYNRGKQNYKTSYEEALIYFTRARDILHGLSKQDTFYQKWIPYIQKKLLQSLFITKNYKKAYQIGVKLLQSYKEENILWMTAVSSYYCGYSDAMQRMMNIEKSTKPNTRFFYQSLYYQGRMFYKFGNYAKAKKKFYQALNAHSKKYPFYDSLLLYFVSCNFVDFEMKFSSQKFLYMEKCLKGIKNNFVRNTALFRETLAKYYLVKFRSKKDRKIIHKVIQLMNYCIKNYSKKSEYYFIRARAYRYIKKYQLSIQDANYGFSFNPNKNISLIERLRLFEASPRPVELFQFLKKISFFIAISKVTKIDIFSEEFEKIRTQYNLLKLQQKNGIHYSEKKFELYYKNLFSTPREVQETIISIISSMRPYRSVFNKLEEKLQNEKIHRNIIKKTLHILQRKQEKREKFLFLSSIAQKNYIKDLGMEYFLSHQKLLKKIVSDRKISMAIDRELWIYMRFRAAKALVTIPKIRASLVREFILSSKHNIESRILIAKAFYDRGMVSFKKSFMISYMKNGKNEFLRAIALSTLVPINAENKKTIFQLLHDPCEKIRVIAASRHAFAPADKHRGELLNVFHKTLSSQNLNLRAFAHLYLWSPEFYTANGSYNRKTMRSFLPLYYKAINSTSESVALACLYHLKKIHYIYQIKKQKILSLLKTVYKNNKSPRLRHKSIEYLSFYGDEETLNAIAFNENAPLIERFIALEGFLNANMENVQSAFKKIKKITEFEKNTVIQGFITYIMSNFIFRMKKHPIIKLLLPLFYRVFQKMFFKNMRGNNDFLKLMSIFSIFNLHNLPKAISNKLFAIMSSATESANVKAACFGAIISIYWRKNNYQMLEKLNKIHKKLQKIHSYQEAWKFISLVAYSHTLIIDLEVPYELKKSIYLGPFTPHFSLQHKYREYNRLLGKVKLRRVKYMYLRELTKVIELLFLRKKLCKREKTLFIDYIYKKSLLYNLYGDYKKATLLCIKGMNKIQEKNPKLLWLWALSMEKQGEGEKAFTIIKKLAKDKDILNINIMRTLAYFHYKKNKKEKAYKILKTQYYFYPDDPQCLLFLAEYLCNEKKYKEAEDICLEYQYHYPLINKRHIIGLARVHASRKQFNKALTNIEKVNRFAFLLPEDLNYPEFKDMRKMPRFQSFVFHAKIGRK